MKRVSAKTFWIVVLIVSILICLLCVAFLAKYLYDSGTSVTKPTDSPTVVSTQTASTMDTTDVESPTQLQPTQPPAHKYSDQATSISNTEYVSFEDMMKINPDIYAWIYIPNTAVDYPVAQSSIDEDDSFYLSHNVYKEYQFSGTIYSEKANSREFDDPVTVLYGHNMLNGSMFASLHNFNDEQFFKDNNTIFVFTKDRLLTYLVYAAYEYDDRHILNSFNFVEKEQMQKYIDSSLSPRSYYCQIRDNVKPTTEDKILTLSTCTSGSSNTRYLVQGVLVNDQPTK